MATTHANLKTPLAVGLCALVGLGVVVALVVTHASATFDRGVEEWIDSHQQSGMRALFFAISSVGGIWAMRALAVFGSAILWYRRRRHAAAALAAALVPAALLYEMMKRVVERPRPAGGNSLDPTFAFPSGHATLSAAVVGALAYVLWRERLVTRPVAFTVAIAVPLIVGFSRVYLDMHWATDVLGGWCAGVVVASAAAVAYEAMPFPQNNSR